MEKRIRYKIFISELLSTQALITPIKTLFFIHFWLQNTEISFLKFVFTLFSFIFEMPSGYFSDKFGNRLSVLLSRFFTIIALIINCIFTNYLGFIISNVFLGLANAWDSGAKDSYYLILCQKNGLSYDSIKIKVVKYSYWVNSFFMVSSSILYNYNMFLPFVSTILLLLFSITTIFLLPKDEVNLDNNAFEIGFKDATQSMLKKVFKNKFLLLNMVFTVLCSTILISNFDFYTLIFSKAGIDTNIIGSIYAIFMIINSIGILIYEKQSTTNLSNLLLLLVPFSFLLLISLSIPLIIIGVILQQLCFAYYNMNFNICLLNCIDDIDTSSQFQSAVSFINVIIRMMLSLVITGLYKVFSMNCVYMIFTIIMFMMTCLYLLKVKGKDS